MRTRHLKSKCGKLLCLAMALVLMAVVIPVGAVSADSDNTAEALGTETPLGFTEPEATPTESEAPAESPEPETAPTPSAEPTVSPEPENTTYANSISGVLWIDASEDGIYDSTESPLAHYPVYLYVEGDTDNVVQTATTDADGTYRFENISPGRYVVGIKAEENGAEYLLPLVGVQQDNKFYFAPDWSKVICNAMDIAADTVVEDIDAAMRAMPQIQPMANTTYMIDITNSTTVTNSITSQSIPGVSITSNVLTFDTTVDSTDTYILTGTTTSVRVVVATGTTANIMLDGASITNGIAPLQLLGTADVKLTLVANNTLRCNYNATVGALSGIFVYVNAKLTIEGTGTLQAIGGSSGTGLGGAGIGGGYISSDTTYSNAGTITINSGTVIATGGTAGAGIGGSGNTMFSPPASGGIITINGGSITATGTDAAGIGGGHRGSCGNITISGGTITANGGVLATTGGSAGIGAGRNAITNGIITISGGMVTARGGYSNSPGIGSWSKTSNLGTTIFTGGSIYPTDSAGTVSVYPNPTNGSTYGNDPVGMFTFTQFAGQDFSIMTAGSAGIAYVYKGTGHTAAAYPWLTYPGVSTDAATVNTTAAVVTAPSTVNSPFSSTTILNGTYYLNNTYGVTSAYFEWGTSTSYGTTIDMTSSVNASTTTTGVYPVSSSALTGLTPGTTYHYRFVIVTNGVTVPGADMTFTSALAPSVDVTHDYPGGTTATLEGIFALNGGTFVSGEFEISSDGGSTWSTPTGGTLTGSTTTPTVNLTGLTPGTTYHYKLTVTNSEGTTTTVMKELTVSAKTVTISNTITGTHANMTKAFTFTVYFEDSAGAPLSSGTQFTYTGGVIAGSGATAPANGTLTLGSGGEATVTLTTGQTITIAGVATFAKVRIVETTDSNYTTSFKDSLDASSTSGADTGVRSMTAADRTFDFTNTRSVVPGGISTGSGGIVLLSLMALLALASGLAITSAYRRRAGAR